MKEGHEDGVAIVCAWLWNMWCCMFEAKEGEVCSEAKLWFEAGEVMLGRR